MNAADAQILMDAYHRHFENSWSKDANFETVRFVALDSETTGLDPEKDSLITIGAIAVQHRQILLEDSFEVMMPIDYNTASVQIHGITAEESRKGIPEPEALLQFLDFLRDAVIVGHHVAFDVDMINRALQIHHKTQLKNRVLDTMDLTLRLNQVGAFREHTEFKEFSLDSLCHRLGVDPHDRHTATGDAFITAQIFLKLLVLSRRHQMETLNQLCQPFEEH